MDICLLPFESSDLTEAALPLKIHEYAACRRPVVSSPLFEVMRMYGGLLAHARGSEEISERVKDLIRDRGGTLRMISRAHRRATVTYNWDRFGSRYEKVFLRVAADPGEKGS
jgi:glycosyltransferase involved in cell wall biosynthesis